MSPFGERFQTMKGAVLGGALLVASAGMGLAWLSIAAVGGTAAVLGLFWARVVVGLLLLSPLAVFVLFVWLRDQKRQDLAPVAGIGTDAALTTIASAAQKMIEKSPLAALALASLAGLIAARFPAALTLLANVLKEYDQPTQGPEPRRE